VTADREVTTELRKFWAYFKPATWDMLPVHMQQVLRGIRVGLDRVKIEAHDELADEALTSALEVVTPKDSPEVAWRKGKRAIDRVRKRLANRHAYTAVQEETGKPEDARRELDVDEETDEFDNLPVRTEFAGLTKWDVWRQTGENDLIAGIVQKSRMEKIRAIVDDTEWEFMLAYQENARKREHGDGSRPASPAARKRFERLMKKLQKRLSR
jgi:hypothetical protein